MFDVMSFPRARLGPRERTLIFMEVTETCLVAYKTTETDFVVFVEIRLEQHQRLLMHVVGAPRPRQFPTACAAKPMFDFSSLELPKGAERTLILMEVSETCLVA